MAPPIYFFPGLPESKLAGPRLNPTTLGQYGLLGILGDVGPVPAFASVWPLPGQGPNSGGGMMLTAYPSGKAPLRLAYLKDLQTWTKVQNDPELWIGIDNEHPPGPEDLVRPETIDGHPVKLTGNEYTVPVIRSPVVGTGLPEDMHYDADGEFVVALQPRWQQLWDDTGEVWDMLYADERGTMAFSRILDFCLRFLGVNYRYGRFEQAAMRLVDTNHSTWNRIFCAALDVPTLDKIAEDQKKSDNLSEGDTLNSEPGQPAEDLNTGQAEQKSPDSTDG